MKFHGIGLKKNRWDQSESGPKFEKDRKTIFLFEGLKMKKTCMKNENEK